MKIGDEVVANLCMKYLMGVKFELLHGVMKLTLVFHIKLNLHVPNLLEILFITFQLSQFL